MVCYFDDNLLWWLMVLVSGHIDMKQISSRVYLFTDHFCRIRFVFIFFPRVFIYS
jgi:hypothetical protein